VEKTEIEKISAMIEEFETLQRAKEKYYSYQQSHSKAHLGLSPDSIEKALWSEAQQLIDEIEVDLVELWDCIEDCTTGEDNFGGWVIPTGTFRQNISRDINSRDPNIMAPLIQQFKRVQRRLEIESQQEQQRKQTTEKPAETEPDTTLAKEEVEKAKPTTSPAGLLKYLNVVLDDIERLEGSRSIRTELATAYHETKKAVEKIRAQNPAIKETPADSNDPREYLRNVHTWCVGQLFWENGERIGETPAATEQDTFRAKLRKIWTCVKRIPRWIYVLVLFLAALIYILRWLWTIFWPE